MDHFDYRAEAAVTMSGNFHTGLVSRDLLMQALTDAVQALEFLDIIKKALFYGRDNPILVGAGERQEIPVGCLHPDLQKSVDLLHGILGKSTEDGELLSALRDSLSANQELDLVNVFEEVGDGQWYDAAILRVLDKTFDDVQRGNISKLRKRFPDGFKEYDANNRQLSFERDDLAKSFLHALDGGKEAHAHAEKVNKPVVRVKDWVVLGRMLIGTALDHPKAAPGSGPTTIRSSSIVFDSPYFTETKNTVYLKCGPAAG